MKNEKRLPVPLANEFPFIGVSSGLLGAGPIGIDPLGSYTGVTEELLEKPVQDADDL